MCSEVIESEQLRLHTMVSDGMVLQRNAPVKIWGRSKAGQKIAVTFIDHLYQTAADINGKWVVMLSAHEAGGPYEMEITGEKTIVLHDILIGDVWVCAGQSNMQLPVERVKDKYADIVSNYENNSIRQFTVPEHYDFKAPCEDTESCSWEAVNHQTILKLSAAGFFFAKELYEKYSVPIGLIIIAIGGSRAESWMSRDSLEKFPEICKIADQLSDDQYLQNLVHSDDLRESRWYSNLDAKDKGLNGPLTWYDEKYDDSGWDSMQIPSYWADEGLGVLNGSFWFRREITIPEGTLSGSCANTPAKIFMGRIVDADYIYINGVLVGTTGYQYPPRKYDIPDGVLKEGKNTIAVRVISNKGKGGFITEKPYWLTTGDLHFDLTGKWKYRIGTPADELSERSFFFLNPVGLYNGMLSPILNYTVRGVIWYQGESNTYKPENYEDVFSSMIQFWREKWKRPDLPFLYVQLPNYLERENPEAINKWALLREAQLKTLKVPNTAMAVAIDIGEWNDLHPLNKQDVGKRLALLARKFVYGEKDLVATGPVYHNMKIENNKLILSFTDIGSGLVCTDGERLSNFEIAGDDGAFHSADAYIENNQVVVSSGHTDKPLAVRYAWSDSPQNINFYNKEGLPASPFRTSQQGNGCRMLKR